MVTPIEAKQQKGILAALSFQEAEPDSDAAVFYRQLKEEIAELGIDLFLIKESDLASAETPFDAHEELERKIREANVVFLDLTKPSTAAGAIIEMCECLGTAAIVLTTSEGFARIEDSPLERLILGSQAVAETVVRDGNNQKVIQEVTDLIRRNPVTFKLSG